MHSSYHSPNAVARRQDERSVRLIATLFLSVLCLMGAYGIKFISFRHGAKSGNVAVLPSPQQLNDELANSRAAVDELVAVAASFEKSMAAMERRVDGARDSVLESLAVPMDGIWANSELWGLRSGDGEEVVGASSEASQLEKETQRTIEALEKKRRILAQRKAEEIEKMKRDAENVKQWREVFIKEKQAENTEKLRGLATEIISDVRDVVEKKKASMEALVEETIGEQHRNPTIGAPQWRGRRGGNRQQAPPRAQHGGYPYGPGDPQFNHHDQQRFQNAQFITPQHNNNANGNSHELQRDQRFAQARAMDPENQQRDWVDPHDQIGAPPNPNRGQQQEEEYVIPRHDQQHAPRKGDGGGNLQQKALGDYGGIVRRPGDQFVDYDNDFYPGVVNDVPGPSQAPRFHPCCDGVKDVAEKNKLRAEAVKEAFVHSWKGYKASHPKEGGGNAAPDGRLLHIPQGVGYSPIGCDEAKPRSRSCKNWNEMDGAHNGFGLTVLDAMTTAYLMGLDDIVAESLWYCEHKLRFAGVDVDGSMFETNIRALGGLLSMYELTGERHDFLLDRAREVGDILLFAFNTSTGIPHSTVNFKTRRHFGSPWGGGNAILSEFGTVQLEFRTLSLHTRNPIYDMKATHATAIIEAKAPEDLLCPLYLSGRRLKWATDHISVGALGDSFYEYIIKQYVLTGNTEEKYAKLSIKMAKGLSKLLFRSRPSNMLYIAEHRARAFHHKMDHLACFAGGMFAMMANELPGLTDDEAAHMMKLAGDLTETCVKMYTMQATGVAPEYVEFPAGADFVNGHSFYILRPETIESVFYMYRYTKDEKWREYGWRMFKAIDRYCRVEGGGFVGIREVNVPDPPQDNLMQSFWLAETLKYFYLLFADDDVLDLGEWVFNTEAHPLKRRIRDPLDIWRDYEERHGAVPWFPPQLQGVKAVETFKMMAMRRDGTVPTNNNGRDPLGADDGEEGMPDDEGLPFDEVNGPRGVPRLRGQMSDFLLLDEGRRFDLKRIRRNGRLSVAGEEGGQPMQQQFAAKVAEGDDVYY